MTDPLREALEAAVATTREPRSADAHVQPCAVLIEGGLASGVLVPGVAYRVAEVREHWEPTGVEGEAPHVTTVVRFDPVTIESEESE